jgi:hypothetical protein
MSNLQSDLTDEKKSITEESISHLPGDQIVARPQIDYSSVGAVVRSTWRRFLSLWTRRFVLCLLAGQVVSLCITCTNVTTEELTNGNWKLPTTQTLFLYLLFFSLELWALNLTHSWADTSPSLRSIHLTRSISVCLLAIPTVKVFLCQTVRWLPWLAQGDL